MTLPIAAILYGLSFGMLGWILAALVFGLWLGERGRRRVVERLLQFGTPDEPGGKVVSRRPAREAEDRIAEVRQEFSEEQVEKVTADLKRQAKEQGLEGISDEQFEEDARMLLSGRDVMPPA